MSLSFVFLYWRMALEKLTLSRLPLRFMLPLMSLFIDLMVSSAHSTAQKNVMKANFSVPGVLMKQDAKLQVNVEIRKNTNGDPELKLSPKLNALDTVQPNVLSMKSYVHHS